MNNYSDSSLKNENTTIVEPIETDYCSDSSLEDDFSFGMQGNQDLDSDSDGENLVSEWSTDDIGQVNEQLILDLEKLDLSCDDASVDNEQSAVDMYDSVSNKQSAAAMYESKLNGVEH